MITFFVLFFKQQLTIYTREVGPEAHNHRTQHRGEPQRNPITTRCHHARAPGKSSRTNVERERESSPVPRRKGETPRGENRGTKQGNTYVESKILPSPSPCRFPNPQIVCMEVKAERQKWNDTFNIRGALGRRPMNQPISNVSGHARVEEVVDGTD